MTDSISFDEDVSTKKRKSLRDALKALQGAKLLTITDPNSERPQITLSRETFNNLKRISKK